MLVEAQLGELVLYINGGNFRNSLAIVGSQNDVDQPLGDLSIAIGMEMKFSGTIFTVMEPDLGHAAFHFGGVGFQGGVHRGNVIAEIDKILVPALPIIEEREIFYQVFEGALWHFMEFRLP